MKKVICLITKRHAPITIIGSWVYCSRCYALIHKGRRVQAV